MAPGFGGLPAAERDVDVSGRVANFLAELPPRGLARVRLGLKAFELLPFPWRFSRLDLNAREDYLGHLEKSTFGPYQDLLLMAKVLCTFGYAVVPAVKEQVGYEVTCALDGAVAVAADPGQASPAGTLGETEVPGSVEECDVVIVGSGAGGAAAAATLAEAGVDVIVLEAGSHFDSGSYPSDPMEAILSLYREAGLTIADGHPPIPIPVARTVGGTTVINSGTCFRAPDQVLEAWERDHGIDWAADVGAEYSEAESFLRVTPVDPEQMGRNGQLTMEGAAALGASGGPISRNAGRCVQCSSCPFGCRIDAKRAMHVSYLPRAVAAGARVRANVEAERVVVENGRATQVACRVAIQDSRERTSPRQSGTSPSTMAEHGGPALAGARAEGPTRPYTVRARTAVIVAGGALGTPELLIRSGLGGKAVGWNLHIHPACWVGARYEEEVRGWEGVMQSYYVDEWERERILLEATFTPLPFGGAWLLGTGRRHQEAMLGFGNVGSIGVHLSDHSSGRVRVGGDGSLRASYKLDRADARRIGYGIARAAEIHFAAGATEVYPNIGRIGVLRPGDAGRLDSIDPKPAELRLEAFHPMGTARMGPEGGGPGGDGAVCDSDGAVRGTRGLYVADASLFPTSVGVNPMMTIIAFSKRVAAGIAARG